MIIVDNVTRILAFAFGHYRDLPLALQNSQSNCINIVYSCPHAVLKHTIPSPTLLVLAFETIVKGRQNYVHFLRAKTPK